MIIHDSLVSDIDELLSLIGVAPRHFDSARKNYADLPPEEISRRLEFFRRARKNARRILSERNVKRKLPIEHPVIPSTQTMLTTANLLEALARLENVLLELKPTCLVGVNAEGMCVAEFVRRHLGLPTPVIEASGTANAGVDLNSPVLMPLASPTIVGVIGHAAKTGETLSKVMEYLRSRSTDINVFGATLIASRDAAVLFEDQPVYFHQLTEQFSDYLSENAVIRLQSAQDVFAQSAVRSADMKTLDLIRSDMADLYPVVTSLTH